MIEVSIIVTTINRKSYLKETIDSILNQSFQDFEIIIVDSYSDYDFFKFIASFDNKKIIAFQNNKGNNNISINRNFGLQYATGKYIAFCDDDDIWFPKKIELQINAMKETCARMSCTEGLFGSGIYDSSKEYKKYNSAKYFPFVLRTSLSKNCLMFIFMSFGNSS